MSRARAARRRFRGGPIAAVAVVLGLAAIVAAPLLSLALIASQGGTEVWEHLASYVLPRALGRTALLLLGVAALVTVLGVGPAWLVTVYRFPARGVLLWLLPLPLAIPTYIVAYIYADLLDAAGPVQGTLRALAGWASPRDYWFPEIRSLGGAICIMSLVLYPYVFLPVRALFQTQSGMLIEAARVLGAGRLRILCDMALPLARPALAVGLALALLEALNDIGASEYLGVQTLTVSVFTTWLNRGSLAGAAQIACAMLVVVVGLLMLERWGRRGRAFATSEQQPRLLPPVGLRGWKAGAACLACALPVVLGFALPLAMLVKEVIARGLLAGFDPSLVRHAATTLLLAASASAVTVALGLLAAVAVRAVPLRGLRGAFAFLAVGYAVPGTVLGLALLSPLVLADEAINTVTPAFGGTGTGLFLAGSSAALVLAYVIRFLAIATGSLGAGLNRVSVRIDETARLLGARRRDVVRLVHLPLLRPSLATAALLIFVDCLKELPATLLLRPLNTETLSTYIYQFAARGSFEEGALAALLIVAVGIFPVVRIMRFADRDWSETRAP